MSRGLGTLQRAILDALPAHELVKHPGVYDLKTLRLALAQAQGRGYMVRGRYSRERNTFWVDSAFAACFSRAVVTLMRRGLLVTWREPSAWHPFGGVWDGGKPRQNIHYSRVHVSRPCRMGVSPEISIPTLSILTGVILPLHGLVTR